MARLIARVLLVVTLGPLTSCAYYQPAVGLAKGREYRAALPELRPGMTESEVRALLGPPHATLRGARRTSLRYRAAYRRGGCAVRVLGILPIYRPPNDVYSLKVVLGSSGLESARLQARLRSGVEEYDVLGVGIDAQANPALQPPAAEPAAAER